MQVASCNRSAEDGIIPFDHGTIDVADLHQLHEMLESAVVRRERRKRFTVRRQLSGGAMCPVPKTVIAGFIATLHILRLNKRLSRRWPRANEVEGTRPIRTEA